MIPSVFSEQSTVIIHKLYCVSHYRADFLSLQSKETERPKRIIKHPLQCL
jgi:hypothetical protein